MCLSFFWKVSRFRYLGIVGLALITTFASAQTTRTWNGTASSDWFNATNWLPTGVPSPNDIVRITNGGFVNLTAPVTISNQLYWSGASLSGSNLNIASSAVMTINTTTTLLLENPLTNAGTVVWSNNNNSGGLNVLNNGGVPYNGLIANLPGALFDIQCDALLNDTAGATAFYNSGTLQKSAGTGTTTIQIPVINSGSITDLQGTLNFQGGGPIAGTFTANTGTGITFSLGTFTNSDPATTMNGPGTFQLTGGALWLFNNAISNLVLSGGNVFLGPAFQGGSITNLTIAGATLSGTNIVTGIFNWSNGVIVGGPLTILHTGVMNISASTTFFLESPLTNSGTINWTNHGDFDVLYNGGVPYSGLIENLSDGLIDIQCDQSLEDTAFPTYFHNLGTLRKSALTGTTSVTIPLFNSGTVTGLEGTLNISGGGTLGGIYNASSGAVINFTGGNFTNSGPVSMNGPGIVRLLGATLFLLSDTITNFPLSSGMVYPGPAFQGGTITNLTINGATLAGTNTVTGVFNFNTGTIAGGSLTIASNGVMNINSTNTTFMQSPLTNFGIVNWTNTIGPGGNLDVENNNGVPYAGLIENLPGALFDIQCDLLLFNNAGGPAYFHNAGTLRKSARTGTTGFDLPIFNSGSVTDLQGTLSFGGGGTLAGNFTASTTNTSINFSAGTFTNSVPVAMIGPGTLELNSSGNLWLMSNSISNLLLVASGTVYLGPAFEGGSITNLTISGATLAGTNTVTGIFNWNNGTIAGGPLTIASNGIMNIAGTTTLFLDNPLTNYGTVTWTNPSGSAALDVLNNGGVPYAGLIENLAGGLFDIQCDQPLVNNSIGVAYFHNTGTLQKSALTGTTGISIPVTNSGTISSLSGNIGFSGGFTPIGGTLLYGLSSPTSYGTMSISGAVTLTGTVGVLWLNGFVPGNSNSFTVLTYGSHTGTFTNFTSPPGAQWTSNYTSTSFTLSIASINQLAFTTQPVGNKLTNVILAPIVVQVEDPSSNAVPVSGTPITLSLSSGAGPINGILSQNTDSSGKATFSGLSFNTSGSKTLRATSPGLTSAISVPFQILPLVGLQPTNTGFLIQLNGSNNSSTVTIYASTNLGNPAAWIPLYTNPPTNGSIQFLDTAATNYPWRFYRFTQP
jgi:hypothetical protein